MSEKPLDLDALQRQINAVQIEMWLPLPVVRVLELAPAMLQEIKDLRHDAEAVREIHQPIKALNTRYPGGKLTQVCTGCGQDNGNWNTYPCPTIRALDEKGTSK